MRIETDSTIAAIATGAVGAIRGAIRITGPDTLRVLCDIFPEAADQWRAMKRATVVRGDLLLDSLGSIPVSVYSWPDHRSYTGQPSAELHLLGAPVLLERVQAKILEAGVRLAQPGEFTLRAFLAGRMDLTQCEAVLGLIHASGERAFQVALSQLAGGLAEPLKLLRRDLIDLLADIEAGLDFVDEDIEFIASEQVIARLDRARVAIEALSRQLEQRAGQQVEFQVAVVGLPNAGKSSLVNAISGRDVSIISDQPGTTRDYVRSRIFIDDCVLDLLDTAGLESPERETPRGLAQEFTKNELQRADLVLVCIARDDEDPAETSRKLSWVNESAAVPVWLVETKTDLELPVAWSVTDALRTSGRYSVSSRTLAGVEDLRKALVSAVRQSREATHDVVPMTGERCRESLVRAANAIGNAQSAAQEEVGDEVVAGELRLALEELGEVAGVVVNNDILDALFSRFCIGK
ncbi:MAG: tRNA modification GTPase [Pirellula sp.]|jgi:tRNA modification GTPase